MSLSSSSHSPTEGWLPLGFVSRIVSHRQTKPDVLCVSYQVIIGDTIPHVLAFIFPFLKDIPVLKLLTNRQAVIVLATVTVSYPLSLHRDISKLSRASGIGTFPFGRLGLLSSCGPDLNSLLSTALVGMLIIVCSVLIEGSRVEDSLRGSDAARFTVIQPRVFEAIGVISFAFVCHHNSLLIYGSLQTPTLGTSLREIKDVSSCVRAEGCQGTISFPPDLFPQIVSRK